MLLSDREIYCWKQVKLVMFATRVTVCKKWRIAWCNWIERNSKIECNLLKMRLSRITKQSIVLVILVAVSEAYVNYSKRNLEGLFFVLPYYNIGGFSVFLMNWKNADSIVILFLSVVDVTKQQQAVCLIIPGVGILDKQNSVFGFVIFETALLGNYFDNDNHCVVVKEQ